MLIFSDISYVTTHILATALVTEHVSIEGLASLVDRRFAPTARVIAEGTAFGDRRVQPGDL